MWISSTQGCPDEENCGGWKWENDNPSYTCSSMYIDYIFKCISRVKGNLLCKWSCRSQHFQSPHYCFTLTYTPFQFFALVVLGPINTYRSYCIQSINYMYTIACHLDVFFPEKHTGQPLIGRHFSAKPYKKMKVGMWLVYFKKGMFVGLKQPNCGWEALCDFSPSSCKVDYWM